MRIFSHCLLPLPAIPAAILLTLVLMPCLVHGQDRLQYAAREIPVRDGKTLAADLYATDTTVAKPVILIQTPYNKAFYRLSLPSRGGPAFPFDTTKYHYVILDWRGFYGSKAADVKGYDRGLDGYDAVEWIAVQRWCNGKVGTWGSSALGAIQFQTARHKPPHLVCAAPCVKDFKTKYSDYFYGGAYRKEHVETLEKLGFLTTDVITSQPTYNLVWRAVENGSDYADEIAVPMLLIGGWFDHYPDDVIRAFQDLIYKSDTKVRNAHKILMGPWTHGEIGLEKQGELSYPNATTQAREVVLQFFGYYLWQEKNGYPLRPPFTYYQLGADEWRDLGLDSSITATIRTPLWLHTGGMLRQLPPVETGASATLSYDPRDPSPSHGGARFNPLDPNAIPGPLDIHNTVESRNDALVFSTDVMQDAIEILGPVTANLFVTSDRTDTDIAVRLCDVYPDGRSMILADGILRGRFRKGIDKQVPLIPGVPDTFRVQLQQLALTVRPGHRLRIVVTSSNYPRFDINLNNGGALYTEGDTLVARNTVHCSAALSSSITLDVLRTVSVANASEPQTVFIGQNYPNPAFGTTVFPCTMKNSSGDVAVAVHDALGRTVQTLYSGEAATAPALLTVNTASLPPGLYQIRILTGADAVSRAFLVAK